MQDLGSVDVSSRPRRSLDTTPHKDALKAASVWFVRLTSENVTNSEREQWLAWRQADPTHEYAWQQIEKVTQKFNASGVSAELGMAALDRPACPTRRRAVQQVVSIVALGGIGWAAYEPLIGQHWEADFETATGEQRRVTLQDGTLLTLNTRSAVDIMFTEQQRQILVRKGEVLIETAQENSRVYRPFFVRTPQGKIEALGTSFSVRLNKQVSQVSLYEGALKIQTSTAAEQRLFAGHATQFTASHIAPAVSISNTRPFWTDGFFVADDMPLIEFIAELARYRRGHLSVDKNLAHLRISGTFPIADTDRVLETIAMTLPVKIETFTRYWVNLRAL